MMKKLILILIVISPISCVMGQDIHFTQTSNTPLLINPAAAGVYDGWERVVINQRNQWLGAGTQFMTTSVAADANFFKDEIKRKAHLGVGLLFFAWICFCSVLPCCALLASALMRFALLCSVVI